MTAPYDLINDIEVAGKALDKQDAYQLGLRDLQMTAAFLHLGIAEQEKPKDNLVNKVDKYFEKKCKKLDNVIKLHDYKKLSKS